GGEAGWTAPSTLAAFGVSAVALVAFVMVERATDHPMLDLRLFRGASFSTLMVAAVLAQAAAFAYLPFVTVWPQQFLGKGPVDAGRRGALPLSVAGALALAAGVLVMLFVKRQGGTAPSDGDRVQVRLDPAASGGH